MRNKTSVFNKLSRVYYAALSDCDIEVIICKKGNNQYRVTKFFKHDNGQGWEVFKGNKQQALNRVSQIFFDEWETGEKGTKKQRRELLERLVARGTVQIEYRTKAQRRKHARATIANRF